MARQGLQKLYADFRKGWVDSANPLQQPEGTVKDIVNFDINSDGTLSKRQGLAKIGDSLDELVSEANLDDSMDAFIWDNVAKDVDRRFLVLRIGYYILIFDISAGVLSLSDQYKLYDEEFYNSNFSEVSLRKMTGVSAFGNFFFAFNGYGTGYFEYDPDQRRISFKEITIKFRDTDFWGQAHATDEELGFTKSTDTETSPWRTYNTYNSGWPKFSNVSQESNPDDGTYYDSPIGYTRKRLGFWPSITVPFSACRAGAGGGINEIQAYNAWYNSTDYFGNTRPPVGRNIFDLYRFTREGEILYQETDAVGSGYDLRDTARETYTLNSGPSKIAFYAGRLWYAGFGRHTSSVDRPIPKDPFNIEGSIYFSQTLGASVDKAGLCYQDNDPTAEDINELLATDGGSFSIKEAGEIRALVPLGSALYILADEGVWRIAGTDFNTFTPEAYTIDKITNKGVTSDTGFSVDSGALFFLTEDALMRVTSEGQLGEISFEDISTGIIDNFFDGLPKKSVAGATLIHDSNKKRLYCFLAIPVGEADSSYFVNKYNTVLVYDIALGCFYKYVLNLALTGARIPAALVATAGTQVFSYEVVTDSLAETVFDSLGEDVTASTGSFFLQEDIKPILLCISDRELFLASFSDGDNYSDLDGSSTYEAYVDIGYDSIDNFLSDRKQAPYVVAYLERDYQVSEVSGD